MLKSKKLDFHTVCAAAISVLSTAVVTLPAVNDKSPILAMAVAFLIGLPIYIVFIKLVSKVNINNDILKKAFLLLLSAFVLYLVAKSFHSVADYFSLAVLPKTPVLLILSAFFILVFYAAVCGGDAVKKFTLLGFLAVAVIIFILAVISFKNLEVSLISRPKFDADFFKTVAKYIVIIFVFSSEILPFQKKSGNSKGFFKSTVLGIGVGALLLTLVVANSVLVFGENYSGEMAFPYSFAVSTFSLGTLFTRLDGFAYFIIVTLNFLKGALCILSCEYLLSPFKIKHRKTLLFILCLLSLLLSFLL